MTHTRTMMTAAVFLAACVFVGCRSEKSPSEQEPGKASQTDAKQQPDAGAAKDTGDEAASASETTKSPKPTAKQPKAISTDGPAVVTDDKATPANARAKPTNDGERLTLERKAGEKPDMKAPAGESTDAAPTKPPGPMRLGDSRGLSKPQPAPAEPTNRSAPGRSVADASDGPVRTTVIRDSGGSHTKPKVNGAPPKGGWGPINLPDVLFACKGCGHEFELPYKEAQAKLREAQKEPDGGVRVLKCPKCSKMTATAAKHCPKCAATIHAMTMKDVKNKTFFDECPNCGHSPMRARLLEHLRMRKEKGQLPDRMIRGRVAEAIEWAKQHGEWQD